MHLEVIQAFHFIIKSFFLSSLFFYLLGLDEGTLALAQLHTPSQVIIFIILLL